MNIHSTKLIGVLTLLATTMLFLPVTAVAEVPSVGTVGLGYTCTDTTSTDHRGEPTGSKSCQCTGGRGSEDCRKMLGECADLRDGSPPGPSDLVCTDEACLCTKKISNTSDRFGLERFNQVTDGTSKVVVLQEQSEKRKNEEVRVRPATAPATETKEEEKSATTERKVRDHRKK